MFAISVIWNKPLIADVESSIVCKKLYTLAPGVVLSKKSMYRLAAAAMFASLNFKTPVPGSVFVVLAVSKLKLNAAPLNVPVAPWKP